MDALIQKHAGIEARILEENHRPHPDDVTIARLKKEKLRLKDAITGH